jgi:hypothetical protein
VGGGLTAVQIKMDLNAGKDIKVGDAVTVGTAIVGVAVAVGVISTSSILVPAADVLGVAAALPNMYGLGKSKDGEDQFFVSHAYRAGPRVDADRRRQTRPSNRA